MKYLGIDYGGKRVGLALSDEEGRIAFPRETVENRGPAKLAGYLKKLISRENVEKVIVGLPLGQDGKDTEQTKQVRNFIEALHREITIPIELENELLTTSIARGEGVAKEHVDASAAALILQSYLDRKNKG